MTTATATLGLVDAWLAGDNTAGQALADLLEEHGAKAVVRDAVPALLSGHPRERVKALAQAYQNLYPENDEETALHHLAVDLFLGLADRKVNLRPFLEGVVDCLDALDEDAGDLTRVLIGRVNRAG